MPVYTSLDILLAKAAYPIAAGTAISRFNNMEVQVPDANMSLGGTNSKNRLIPDQYLPIFQDSPSDLVPGPNAGTTAGGNGVAAYRLFRDISATEAAAGVTIYRGIFLQVNTTDQSSVTLDVYSNGPSVGTIQLGTEALSTGVLGDKYVQRIATESTAPSTVVFGSYTSSASTLSLGTVASGGYAFLWLKLTLGAGASAKAYDNFSLVFRTSGSSFSNPVFFHTVGAGITSASVSGLLDGMIVQHPFGETYTISTTNSSGTATDPPSNLVMVYTASSFSSPMYQDRTLPQIDSIANADSAKVAGLLNPSASVVGQAIKTATGVYQYRFKPPVPGYYYLTFDCGGEVQATRGVEVTPVA